MNDLFENIKENYKPVKWANDNNYYGSRLVVRPHDDKLDNVADIRFYVSRSGNTTYCRMWLRLGGRWGYGVGKADGYGYDRESSAFVNALEDMGIDANALRKATDSEYGPGLQPGVGMSTALPAFVALLPDADKLFTLSTGA